MPHIRHMDPSCNVVRRDEARERCVRLVNEFCEVCDRAVMVRLEAAFLEAVNDWTVYMRHTTCDAKKQLRQVEAVIDRARDLVDGGKTEEIVIVYETKAAKREAMRRCKALRHTIRTHVDRDTAEVYHRCVRCCAEMRLSPKVRLAALKKC